MHRNAILCSLLAAATGLDVKWTPASDGGPARFSKRYRDAAGIDDSKWTDDADSGASWMPAVLPETPAGWAMAIAAAIACYFLYQQQQPVANYARDGHNAAGRPGDATEAARAAFLKRFDQPGEVAAPTSRKVD